MGLNELAFRFSEEKYSSKSEISKELGTSLVDNIWQNVINYRSQYNTKVALHNLDMNIFNICNCKLLLNNTNKLEQNILKYFNEIESLAGANDYSTYEKEVFLKLSSYLNIFNKNLFSYDELKSICNGNISVFRNDQQLFVNYFASLNNFKTDYLLDNKDKILELAKRLDGSIEYRLANDKSLANKVIIDRIATSASFKLIPVFMDELTNFIKNSEINPLVKSLIIYFYICLIKPFSLHNEEVALLVAKNYLVKEIGVLAILLPLEKILIDENKVFSKAMLDSQKYNDLTYFVISSIENLFVQINDYLDDMAVFKGKLMANEFAQEDKDDIDVLIEENPIIENKEDEEKIEVEKKEEIKPTNSKIAYNFIPEAIDEKEAKRLEEHLLEIEPEMKKSEAKFYSRHCTLGKKYTIQQYKRSIGCVYETARTSMEHLVMLGYYKKEQVKNKFVYSPVLRN